MTSLQDCELFTKYYAIRADVRDILSKECIDEYAKARPDTDTKTAPYLMGFAIAGHLSGEREPLPPIVDNDLRQYLVGYGIVDMYRKDREEDKQNGKDKDEAQVLHNIVARQAYYTLKDKTTLLETEVQLLSSRVEAQSSRNAMLVNQIQSLSERVRILEKKNIEKGCC